jgi:hypothetical protein
LKASEGALESAELFRVVAMTPAKKSLAMVCNTKCNEKVNVNLKAGGKRLAAGGTGGDSRAAQPAKKTKT